MIIEALAGFGVITEDSDTGKQFAGYLRRPELVLDRRWAMPGLTLHALGDYENSDSKIEAEEIAI